MTRVPLDPSWKKMFDSYMEIEEEFKEFFFSVLTREHQDSFKFLDIFRQFEYPRDKTIIVKLKKEYHGKTPSEGVVVFSMYDSKYPEWKRFLEFLIRYLFNSIQPILILETDGLPNFLKSQSREIGYYNIGQIKTHEGDVQYKPQMVHTKYFTEEELQEGIRILLQRKRLYLEESLILEL